MLTSLTTSKQMAGDNMSRKYKLTCLIPLFLVYGCVSGDVYVEEPELSDVPGYKGVNISKMWQAVLQNSDGEVQSYTPLKLEMGKTSFFTFNSSAPYMAIEGEEMKVRIIKLPDTTQDYNFEMFSYSNGNVVFKPTMVLVNNQFIPVSDKVSATWIERENDIINYFYTNIEVESKKARYVLIYADNKDIGEENFAWDARYNYYKENGTDYPRDYTLLIENSGVGVLSARAYKN